MARLFLCILIYLCLVDVAGCFQKQYWPKTRILSEQKPSTPITLTDVLKTGSSEREKSPKKDSSQSSSSNNDTLATVVRLAARPFDKNGSSKPSSREYTTRKVALNTIIVTKKGVQGDYNHYRTIALKSTPDRAISLLTTDVMEALQSSFSSSAAPTDGDLGENVLLSGIAFNDVKVGQLYTFSDSLLVIEITEPMIPCANLCKLPCINDNSLTPKERISKCQALLEFLDKPGDGFRGWYAKVVTPGEVSIGAEFRRVVNE